MLNRLLLVLLIFLPNCGPSEPQGVEIGQTVDEILCANWATESLLKTLVADDLPVRCLLAADQSADDFQPTREQLQQLQHARLIVLSGNHLEKWADRSNLPSSRVADSGRALIGHLIMVEGKAHSHGAGGEHSHKQPVPYVWLDPLLLAKQAEYISAAVGRSFPDHAKTVDKRLQEFAKQMLDMDQQWRQLRDAAGEQVLPGSHEAFQYLSKRYKLSFDGPDPGQVDLLLDRRAASLTERLHANLSYYQSLLDSAPTDG